MSPATRTTRRSLRSRREASVGSIEEANINNRSQNSSDTILRHPSSSGSEGDPDHLEKRGISTKTNRSVTFALGGNQTTETSLSMSETSLSTNNATETSAGLSARARRSKRRQAQIETDPTKTGSSIKKVIGKRALDSKIKKDYTKGSSMSNIGTTMMKKGAGGAEEEVVKVKLNTGTLYLYKGLNRRAVFVRRV